MADSQQPIPSDYYVVRFIFDRLPNTTDTGILLLPTLPASEYILWNVEHIRPTVAVADKTIIKNNEAWPQPIRHILQTCRDHQSLMFPTGERVVVQQGVSLDLFAKLLFRTMPLYDEVAMIAADTAVKRVLTGEDFGTWADMVVDAIERKGACKGFFWQPRAQYYQDPPNKRLDFVTTFEGNQEEADSGVVDLG